MEKFRIQEVRVAFEDFAYRAPMKFRGTVVDRVTLLNVSIRCETHFGTVEGFGSMPLGNVWAFPSVRLPYGDTLAAMKQLALSVGAITESCRIEDHPIEINHQLEPQYFEAADALAIGEPMPRLCALVVASPFDAALHDAYGKAHGLSCYDTYGPDHMKRDLGHYLDEQFQGEYLDRYVSRRPAESLALYHLVGALDALTEADLTARLGDGTPETVEEWVRAEAVDHIKIKLDGNDLDWDVNRVVAVDRVLTAFKLGANWCYSLDFNERCENVEYVLDCLARVRESSAPAFARIQYVEQPTHRNLFAAGTPDMHAAAKIKPVVIDESLVDYQSLLRARELGYSGVALKACKGQSNALLMAAAAQKFGMFLCVQDLTCPGASLVQSVGLAAHVPPIRAVESNARQYV
ncbi:MAG: hypothetical protein M3Y27_07380, partial [Acidobacteriota bacterium]|nr:hypothetical protein [Acidobacteriota bacterium]